MLQATIRAGRVVLGSLLMIVGVMLSLPFVPGPGIVLLIGGLALLGREFHWARRTNQWLRARARRLVDRDPT